HCHHFGGLLCCSSPSHPSLQATCAGYSRAVHWVKNITQRVHVTNAPSQFRRGFAWIFKLASPAMSKKTTGKVEALKMIEETSHSDTVSTAPTQKAKAQAGRIMYIECKAGDLTGAGRIGRVTFSKTGRTLYYRGHKFQSLKGA